MLPLGCQCGPGEVSDAGVDAGLIDAGLIDAGLDAGPQYPGRVCASAADCNGAHCCLADTSGLKTVCSASCALGIVACTTASDCALAERCVKATNFNDLTICSFDPAAVPAGRIICPPSSGGRSICAQGAACCVSSSSSSLTPAGQCGAPDASVATPCAGPSTDYVPLGWFACDGPEDCASGQSCCYQSQLDKASCRPTCPVQSTLCHDSAQCPDAGACGKLNGTLAPHGLLLCR